jgi:hypothetical protein
MVSLSEPSQAHITVNCTWIKPQIIEDSLPTMVSKWGTYGTKHAHISQLWNMQA